MSHLKASLIVRDKVSRKTVSTNHNLFKEKGQPKRNRTRGPSAYTEGQSRKTVSTNHNLFQEKGEPKRNRTRGPSAYKSNAYR